MCLRLHAQIVVSLFAASLSAIGAPLTCKLRSPQAVVVLDGTPRFAIGYHQRSLDALWIENLASHSITRIPPRAWLTPFLGTTEHQLTDVLYDPGSQSLWLLTKLALRTRQGGTWRMINDYRFDLDDSAEGGSFDVEAGETCNLDQNPHALLYETKSLARREPPFRPTIYVFDLAFGSTPSALILNYRIMTERGHLGFSRSLPVLQRHVLEPTAGRPISVFPRAESLLFPSLPSGMAHALCSTYDKGIPMNRRSYRTILTESNVLIEELSVHPKDGAMSFFCMHHDLERRDVGKGTELPSNYFSHVDPFMHGTYFRRREPVVVYFTGIGLSDPIQHEEFLISGTIPFDPSGWFRAGRVLESVRPECVALLFK